MSQHVTKINIAIAGLGLAGKRHVEAIAASDNIQLSAVVDPHTESSLQGVAHYRSLAEMFAQHQPDGVILATPNNLHVENALVCVKHHCPMLIEKPIATTTAETHHLLAEADKANLPILVGHHRRHHPLVQKARAIIDSQKLGEIRAIHGTCWFYKPDDYFTDTPWRMQKGAGPVFVNLIHDVDLLRYFCGEVQSVYAQSTASIRGYENEDVAVAILTFSNGALCTLSVADSIVAPWSWEMTAKENPIYPHTQENCYIIGGSDASLAIPQLTLWDYKAQKSWWQPISNNNIAYDESHGFINQMQHFARVILGTEKPLISGQEGLKSLQVIEAILQSAHRKQIINL